MIAVTFKGWPVEAVEFYEGLQADNTKTYWEQHKSVYEFSADELFVGSGLYRPEPDQLRRFRAAVDDGKSGSELESIVATLRKDGYDVGAHEVLKSAPKGYPKDHPRIELLNQKGIVMSKSWPVAAWLGTRKAKDRVVACLDEARPLNSWLERYIG